MNELNREFVHNCTIHTSIPTMKTIDETAVLLGLPKHWVRQKVLNGEIVAVRSGKRYLVNVDKLIEYLNSNTLKPAESAASYGGIKPVSVKL